MNISRISKCLTLILPILIMMGMLSACGDDDKSSKVKEYDGVLKVGVTAGPHEIILENIKDYLNQNGVKIKIVSFSDFNSPNRALAEGELDCNIYQHQPFLDDQVRVHGYPLKSIAKTILLPMGVYSKKISRLSELKEGDTITISDDPTNLTRSLDLLEAHGLIKLDRSVENPTSRNIIENPRKLKIVEIEAPNLPRTLGDVTASVINSDWVVTSGVIKVSDSIARESIVGSPFTNIMAYNTELVVEGSKRRKDLLDFVKYYNSEFTANFINKYFDGAILPAW